MTEKITLKPAQEEAVRRWMNEPTGAILCADKPGVGKTGKAVEFGLRTWAQKVLIIGIRDSYDDVWAPRVTAQSDGFVNLRRIDASKSGQQAMADYLAGARGWYFVGHEFLAAKDHRLESHNPPKYDKNGKEIKKRVRLKTWDKIIPDLIINDESHKQSTRYTRGNDTLKALKATWKLALSATPSADRFENFYGVISWLWPDRIDPSFARWKMQWCATDKQYVAGGRAISKVIGEKNPGALVASLPCYTRDEGDEEEAPKAIRIEVDLTPEQRRVYDQLENELLSWIKGHPFSIDFPVTLGNHLYAVTMAEPTVTADGEIFFAEDAGSSKLDATQALLTGELKGEPVLHLTHSKKYAKLAVRRLTDLGYRVAEYTGDVKSTDRKRIKEEFIAGDIDHIVATAQTIGTSTDGLQKRCSTLIWHSKVWGRPSLLEQSVNRIWRQGGDLEKFRQYEIVARNTKDTGIFSSLDLQLAEQQITLRKEQ